jgi:hypothetical protein
VDEEDAGGDGGPAVLDTRREPDVPSVGRRPHWYDYTPRAKLVREAEIRCVFVRCPIDRTAVSRSSRPQPTMTPGASASTKPVSPLPRHTRTLRFAYVLQSTSRRRERMGRAELEYLKT